MANLDAHRFLDTVDPLEIRLIERVAARVFALQEIRDENLAKRIRNEVLEGLGG